MWTPFHAYYVVTGIGAFSVEGRSWESNCFVDKDSAICPRVETSRGKPLRFQPLCHKFNLIIWLGLDLDFGIVFWISHL